MRKMGKAGYLFMGLHLRKLVMKVFRITPFEVSQAEYDALYARLLQEIAWKDKLAERVRVLTNNNTIGTPEEAYVGELSLSDEEIEDMQEEEEEYDDTPEPNNTLYGNPYR